MDTDIFNYIQQALKSKSEKKYAVPNVHLCVLCLIDGTSWVFDEYGSTTYHLVDGRRKAFFQKLDIGISIVRYLKIYLLFFQI